MNRPDDPNLDLHDHLIMAFDDEPAMGSTPLQDLERGRRLAFRRRLTHVAGAAVVVPAMAVGGWVATDAFHRAPGTGSVRMQPAGPGAAADDTESDQQSNDGDIAQIEPAPGGDPSECSAVIEPYDVPDGAGSGSGARPHSVSAADQLGTAKPTGKLTTDDTQGQLRSVGEQRDPGSAVCTVAGEEPMGTLEPACEIDPEGNGQDSSEPVCAVEGPAVEEDANIQRLSDVLTRHVDPTNEHSGSSLAGVSPNDGNGPSDLFLGLEWIDADATGYVALSVVDGGPPVEQCADSSIVGGPEVWCDARILDDGTTVFVGRGLANDAQRMSVSYQRPDGSIVRATADQASEFWWDDKSGPVPLDVPPASEGQLIDMVLDHDAHL